MIGALDLVSSPIGNSNILSGYGIRLVWLMYGSFVIQPYSDAYTVLRFGTEIDEAIAV